eukprot:TRINITY_DN14322_c0_g1_i1.p1 TRINITY_DN14322_c0_g1~~TRINITY_DN14322_c0_g1_i1.p1  ORF type:complete len:233 (-),score=71.32 TRINITY_DN14322_c0_g1_i1:135-800(-)
MLCCCSLEEEAPKQELVTAISMFETPPSLELDPQVEVEESLNAAGNPVLSMDRTEGAALGVVVDMADPNNLAVQRVSDGILKSAAEASKTNVKAGFRIISVNGISAEAKDMVAILQQKKPLVIEFEAFEEKKIKVEKGDKKLGVVFGFGKDGTTWLTVKKIEGEGVIPDWNAAAAPEQQVMVSDKIVAIDGQEASTKEMMKWMKEKSSMELTVYSWKSLQA